MDWILPDETLYRERVAKAQARMRAAGITLLATTGKDAHRFFGGVDGLAHIRVLWLLIPDEGDPQFVSPRVETEEVQAQSWIPVTSEYVEWDDREGTPLDHFTALAALLEGAFAGKLSRVGVDGYQAPFDLVEKLRGRLGEDRVVDASALLLDTRLIKDRGVIDVVRRCGDIVGHEYRVVRSMLRPGMTDWEVGLISRNAGTNRAGYWWADSGAYSPLIPGCKIINSGRERGSRGHAVASGRVLQRGDLIQVCYCGVPFFGHSIGFDRPLIVGDGRLDDDIRKVVDVALEAKLRALDAIRPGATGQDVHRAAMGVVEKAGMMGALRHRTGRGLGCCEVEHPDLKEGDTTPLQPGMIVAVEPGIYLDGVASARFGDTVLITDSGFEPLTPIDEGLELRRIPRKVVPVCGLQRVSAATAA